MKRLAVILLLALAMGCIHKPAGTTVTPMERVTTDNAVFAQLDNSIEQGAEAVASSGLLKPAQVAPVIGWCGQVAQAHQQVTAILDKSSPVTAGDYASIQALITQIQTSGASLVGSGDLGIKNPKTQQTIAQDIQAASDLAGALLTEVAQLEGK